MEWNRSDRSEYFIHSDIQLQKIRPLLVIKSVITTASDVLFQLRRAQEEGLIFPGFNEAPITFKPTYKFDPGTDTYDTR